MLALMWKLILAAFSNLDDAKNKCFAMIELGDNCGGITKTSSGYELRLGPSLAPNDKTSYTWHRYSTEDFEINLSYEK